MIITNKFVFMHYPKNGGTFVEETLQKVWDHLIAAYPQAGYAFHKRWDKNLNWKRVSNKITQHGKYSQLPRTYRHLPIFSIIRNPFDRLVSLYYYKFWVTDPYADSSVIQRQFPAFPDLTFKEFYRMQHSLGRENLRIKIPRGNQTGLQSLQFMQMFFYDPDKAVGSLDDRYLRERLFVNDMPPVLFLRNETLNADLHRYLYGMGIPHEAIDFILEAPRVYPHNGKITRDPGDNDWKKYYDEEIIAEVVRREKLLFEIFPDYLPAEYRGFLDEPFISR